MATFKKRKLGSERDLPARLRTADNDKVEDDDVDMEDADRAAAKTDEQSSDEGDGMAYSKSASPEPDTEDEIADALRRKKSKKTAKRKLRATEPAQFGSTLEGLLNTSIPGSSTTPLALKPSINRRKREEREGLIARRAMESEKKEHEEVGRVTDIIGGWGGENERALRKVAQRGGEFLLPRPEFLLIWCVAGSGTIV